MMEPTTGQPNTPALIMKRGTRPDCQTSRAIRMVSTWLTWFTAMMTPPSLGAGMRSRWRHRIRNSSPSKGYRIATHRRTQNPALGVYWRLMSGPIGGYGGEGSLPVVRGDPARGFPVTCLQRRLSSAGQSNRLVSDRSSVRTRQAAPAPWCRRPSRLPHSYWTTGQDDRMATDADAIVVGAGLAGLVT